MLLFVSAVSEDSVAFNFFKNKNNAEEEKRWSRNAAAAPPTYTLTPAETPPHPGMTLLVASPPPVAHSSIFSLWCSPHNRYPITLLHLPNRLSAVVICGVCRYGKAGASGVVPVVFFFCQEQACTHGICCHAASLPSWSVYGSGMCSMCLVAGVACCEANQRLPTPRPCTSHPAFPPQLH